MVGGAGAVGAEPCHAAALADLAAGRLDLVVSFLAESQAWIEVGEIRALATMADPGTAPGASLSPALPTLDEAAGLSWTFQTWRGLVGPKRLGEKWIDRLSAVMKRIVAGETFNRFMGDRGFQATFASPERFAELISAHVKARHTVSPPLAAPRR